MHYLPDTNDEESLQERYWPDSYKQVIREVVRGTVEARLNNSDIERIYQRYYKHSFKDLEAFRLNLVNAAVIGAENGADEGFELVYSAFLKETALPEAYPRTAAIWPFRISLKDRRRLHRAIVADYFIDDGFNYAYRDGYKKQFSLFSSFINAVADLLAASTIEGVNITLERHYEAFFHGFPLPVMRRNPRRLKTW
jgi:hypothetical protein